MGATGGLSTRVPALLDEPAVAHGVRALLDEPAVARGVRALLDEPAVARGVRLLHCRGELIEHAVERGGHFCISIV
jgi:hypothetical protein